MTTPDSFEFRLSVLNRNAKYWAAGGLKSYSSRVDDLARVASRSRASVDIGCEAGDYNDGAAYNRQRGWGAKRVKDDRPLVMDSFVLHGGAVPVTTSIDIDPSKRMFIATGQFQTAGTRNRWATWAVIEDAMTEIRVLVGATHLEFEPKGKNYASHWGNQRRYDQLNAMMSALAPIATRYKVSATIVGGDMNGLKSDPNDGPGKAAKEHGYIDIGPTRIDRIFVKGNITASEVTATKAHPATDLNHYLISALLKINR